MTLGIISMRNEDGTQWLENVEGTFQWTDERRYATPFPEFVKDAIIADAPERNKNDCPDNGFFGVYSVAWRACK